MELHQINYEQLEELIEDLDYKDSYEYEYYHYMDRLKLLKTMIDKISLNEIDLIVNKWKPEEAVRYLYTMIKEIKQIS